MQKKRLLTIMGSAKRPIVRDSFDRADSAITLGSADTGQAWTKLAGTWGISSNKAYLVSNTGQAVAVIDSGYANLNYTVDITTSPTASRVDCGLVFRATDNSNFLLLAIEKSATANTIKLWKNDAASFGVLAQDLAAGLAENTLYTTNVVLSGNNISIYLNSVLCLSYVLTGDEITKFGTQTKIGIRVNYGGSADDKGTRFDNLVAYINP